MQFTQKLGFVLVSAALVAAYGCGQKEEPKKAEKPARSSTRSKRAG